MSPSADSRGAVVSYWRKYVQEVLVNRLGGLSLPRKSVVRLTYRPNMTLDVYRGRKTTVKQNKTLYFQLQLIQQYQQQIQLRQEQLEEQKQQELQIQQQIQQQLQQQIDNGNLDLQQIVQLQIVQQQQQQQQEQQQKVSFIMPQTLETCRGILVWA